MPPSWASASTISTPGKVGSPGKCPEKNASSPVRCHRPRADTPGTTSSISSTNRNGGRCGSTSSGRMGDRLSDGLLELVNAAGLLAVDVTEPAGFLAESAIEERAEDDDRLVGPHLANVFGDVDPVALGHDLVEHDDVRVEGRQFRHHVGGTGEPHHLVTVVAQDAAHQPDHLHVVVDQQDAKTLGG